MVKTPRTNACISKGFGKRDLMPISGPSSLEIVIPVLTDGSARFPRGSVVKYTQNGVLFLALVKAHDPVVGFLVVRPLPNGSNLILPPIGIKSDVSISSMDGSLSVGTRGPFFAAGANASLGRYAVCKNTGYSGIRHEVFASYAADGLSPTGSNSLLFKNSMLDSASIGAWQKLLFVSPKQDMTNPGFSPDLEDHFLHSIQDQAVGVMLTPNVGITHLFRGHGLSGMRLLSQTAYSVDVNTSDQLFLFGGTRGSDLTGKDILISQGFAESNIPSEAADIIFFKINGSVSSSFSPAFLDLGGATGALYDSLPLIMVDATYRASLSRIRPSQQDVLKIEAYGANDHRKIVPRGIKFDDYASMIYFSDIGNPLILPIVSDGPPRLLCAGLLALPVLSDINFGALNNGQNSFSATGNSKFGVQASSPFDSGNSWSSKILGQELLGRAINDSAGRRWIDVITDALASDRVNVIQLSSDAFPSLYSSLVPEPCVLSIVTSGSSSSSNSSSSSSSKSSSSSSSKSSSSSSSNSSSSSSSASSSSSSNISSSSSNGFPCQEFVINNAFAPLPIASPTASSNACVHPSATSVTSTMACGISGSLCAIEFTVSGITHTNIGDLKIFVTAPWVDDFTELPATITLLNRPGKLIGTSPNSYTHNLSGTYTFSDNATSNIWAFCEDNPDTGSVTVLSGQLWRATESLCVPSGPTNSPKNPAIVNINSNVADKNPFTFGTNLWRLTIEDHQSSNSGSFTGWSIKMFVANIQASSSSSSSNSSSSSSSNSSSSSSSNSSSSSSKSSSSSSSSNSSSSSKSSSSSSNSSSSSSSSSSINLSSSSSNSSSSSSNSSSSSSSFSSSSSNSSSSSSSSHPPCIQNTFNKIVANTVIPDAIVGAQEFCINQDSGLLTDSLVINSSGTICSLSVIVNIAHISVGDLRIYLETPWNSQIVLMDRIGKTSAASAYYLQNLGNAAGAPASYYFADSGGSTAGMANSIWAWCEANGNVLPAGDANIIPSGSTNVWKPTLGLCGLPDANRSSPIFFSITQEVSDKDMYGEWILHIEDHRNTRSGVFAGWSLVISAFGVVAVSSSSSSSSSVSSSSSSLFHSSSSSYSSSSSLVEDNFPNRIGWFFDAVSSPDTNVQTMFGMSGSVQPFGGSICDAYGFDFSPEIGAVTTGYADSITGIIHIDSRSSVGKYDIVTLDVHKEQFFNAGIVGHSVVEDTFEGVNSGAPASFSQVQHLNILNHASIMLDYAGVEAPAHSSSKMLKASDLSWMDQDRSSICFDELLDSGSDDVDIDQIFSLCSSDDSGLEVAGAFMSSCFRKNIDSSALTIFTDISNFGIPLKTKIISGKLQVITTTHYLGIDNDGAILEQQAHQGILGNVIMGCFIDGGIIVTTERNIYLRILAQEYFKLVFELPYVLDSDTIVASSDGIAIFVTPKYIVTTTNGRNFAFATILGGSDSNWIQSGKIDDVCIFNNKIIVTHAGHAWHDNGSVMVGGAPAVQMSRIIIPSQNIVDSIDSAIGSVISCCLFRNEDSIISRLLLGGDSGFASIYSIPISFNQMSADEIRNAVQYTNTDIPAHFVRSSNGKIISAFLDSVFVNSISNIVSIRNGVVL